MPRSELSSSHCQRMACLVPNRSFGERVCCTLLVTGSASPAKVLVSHHLFAVSVEALAPALVPVAVDHRANDDEKDAAQHRKEHCEEDAKGAHPFVGLAHWRREEDTVMGTQSQWEAGMQVAAADSRLSSSMLSTLGSVISSSSSSFSSFSLRSTVSW